MLLSEKSPMKNVIKRVTYSILITFLHISLASGSRCYHRLRYSSLLHPPLIYLSKSIPLIQILGQEALLARLNFGNSIYEVLQEGYFNPK